MIKHILVLVMVFVILASCKNQTNKKILLTDDFESYPSSENNLGNWTTEGNVKISADNFYSGTKALKLISGEGYTNRAFVNYSNIFPIHGNTFYGSMMLYINEASPNGIHWTMIQGSGKVKNHDYTAAVRFGGQYQKKLMANYDTQGVYSDCWKHSEFVIPEKKWTKYQWYFNGNTNTMKLWVNNILIEELTVTKQGHSCIENDTNNQWLFPEFEKLTIGWVDYQKNGGQRELWIDDVIIWVDQREKIQINGKI